MVDSPTSLDGGKDEVIILKNSKLRLPIDALEPGPAEYELLPADSIVDLTARVATDVADDEDDDEADVESSKDTLLQKSSLIKSNILEDINLKSNSLNI